MFWPAASLLMLTLGALQASADVFTSTIGVGNSSLTGFSGPYANVNISLNAAGTVATVTFTSDIVGGNIYLMGDGGSADLNVNGAYTLAIVTESNAGTGFTPTFLNNTSGNADGFGVFNLSLNNTNGFSDSADTISITLTKNSGTWSSAANVLTPNADGFDAAVHTFVTSSPANVSNGVLATGFAAETGVGVVPEPVSMLLFGTGLVALGAKFRRRKSGNLVAA